MIGRNITVRVVDNRLVYDGGEIICSYFTPDYAAWADRLRASLAGSGVPFDLMAVEKRPGGWEANTMLKPRMVLQAMTKHPTKKVVFVDADAVLAGDITKLTQASADVSLYWRAKRKRGGRVVLKPMSGTLVIRDNDRSRRFIENWIAATTECAFDDTDETALALAITRTPGLTIEAIDHDLVAIGEPTPASVIVHAKANREHKKVKPWARVAHELRVKLGL